MNKTELITAIAEDCGLTKKDTEKAVDAFMKVVGNSLKKGEKVSLIGFGTFEVRHRESRTGRNPRNPEQIIQIPAKKAAVFKAGKTLKELVNA